MRVPRTRLLPLPRGLRALPLAGPLLLLAALLAAPPPPVKAYSLAAVQTVEYHCDYVYGPACSNTAVLHFPRFVNAGDSLSVVAAGWENGGTIHINVTDSGGNPWSTASTESALANIRAGAFYSLGITNGGPGFTVSVKFVTGSVTWADQKVLAVESSGAAALLSAGNGSSSGPYVQLDSPIPTGYGNLSVGVGLTDFGTGMAPASYDPGPWTTSVNNEYFEMMGTMWSTTLPYSITQFSWHFTAGPSDSVAAGLVLTPSASGVSQVTIHASPAGLINPVTVDGTLTQTPATFLWPTGTAHNLTALGTADDASLAAWLFGHWSQGGGASQSYTAAGNTTLVAYFGAASTACTGPWLHQLYVGCFWAGFGPYVTILGLQVAVGLIIGAVDAAVWIQVKNAWVLVILIAAEATIFGGGLPHDFLLLGLVLAGVSVAGTVYKIFWKRTT